MKKIISLCALFFVMQLAIASAAVKVAIVFDAGGKFDRSFNQSAWEGAAKAEKDLNIVLKDVEPGDSSAVTEAMRSFAKSGYDIIFGIGFGNSSSVEKAAKEFPNTKFAIVDSVIDLPNVASLVFKEQEGSFLVGMLAAMRSRVVDGKRTLGFIGGMDIPLIHRFELGYVQGAKTIYPSINVLVNYVGNTPTAWNDPAKGKEIANAQISKGASVIYSAAGGSGNGMFDAIKAKNGAGSCLPKKGHDCVYAIGVDSNQNYIVPGQVLTSMLKRVDIAVYDTIKSVVDGQFESGLTVFGLDSNGLGYALDEHNSKLINKKMKKVVDNFRAKIINGSLDVKEKR